MTMLELLNHLNGLRKKIGCDEVSITEVNKVLLIHCTWHEGFFYKYAFSSELLESLAGGDDFVIAQFIYRAKRSVLELKENTDAELDTRP